MANLTRTPPIGGSQPPFKLHWPSSKPVSTHTSNLRLNMMNQDPKDLHTARAMIEELRSKVRFQTDHIMKWHKAYAIQVQQHYRYQKEKTDQMNALTTQLLLLECRLKRKQKQIAGLLNHRDLTIQQQQKTIERFGILNESTNDSDSAIVIEDNELFSTFDINRQSSGTWLDEPFNRETTIVLRSISDAIETNLSKYGSNRRNNCFLRRPDILETVYSVEEDPEPASDVNEKRDKFKNRSNKALSSGSSESHYDSTIGSKTAAIGKNMYNDAVGINVCNYKRKAPPNIVSGDDEDCTTYVVVVPQLQPSLSHKKTAEQFESTGSNKSQVVSFNRVMSNHRSVIKPKDVKYKRINKTKSKSLEELRGRLKNLVERGNTIDDTVKSVGMSNINLYARSIVPQTKQSFA